MMKKKLKILGQVITGIIILSLGTLLIYFTVPGHRNFCDADQIYLYYLGLLFFVITIGFLINSIIFLVKKQWIKYRIIAISLTLLIGLLILFSRSILTKTIYGQTLHTVANQDNAGTLIKMRLFKNHKFISETYDSSCNVENTGTYKLTENELILHFNGEKSEYLESRYLLKNDTLISLERDNYKLIMK